MGFINQLITGGHHPVGLQPSNCSSFGSWSIRLSTANSTDSCLDKLETYKGFYPSNCWLSHMIPRLYIYICPNLSGKLWQLYVDICGVIWDNIGYWYNRFYIFFIVKYYFLSCWKAGNIWKWCPEKPAASILASSCPQWHCRPLPGRHGWEIFMIKTLVPWWYPKIVTLWLWLT